MKDDIAESNDIILRIFPLDFFLWNLLDCVIAFICANTDLVDQGKTAVGRCGGTLRLFSAPKFFLTTLYFAFLSNKQMRCS